jgi:magnesium chelatase family protein
VLRARDIQKRRYETMGEALQTNAQASGKVLESIAPLEDAARATLDKATETLKLSARGYHRIIRVARTIADLEDAPTVIHQQHIAEALSYRRPRHI